MEDTETSKESERPKEDEKEDGGDEEENESSQTADVNAENDAAGTTAENDVGNEGETADDEKGKYTLVIYLELLVKIV